MPLSPQHYLIAVLVALVAGFVAASWFGVFQRARAEAQAGTDALCALKWREYAHLIEDILIERGFKRAGGDRRPGEGGFDLLMERGKSKYLVDCKNGSSHEITEKDIKDLATVMQMQGAEGAVFATTGGATAAAARLAAHRRIEILAGEELWRQARPWVPHEMREEVQAEARAERNRLGLYSLGTAVAGGLLALLVVPALQRGAVDLASAGQDAAITASAPSHAAADAADEIPLPPDLTPAEAEARRTTAALEVRSLPAVHNATWSTRSTLLVTLKPGVKLSTEMTQEMCQRVLQFEELRYIRMQIETPSEGGEGASIGNVRWRQCR